MTDEPRLRRRPFLPLPAYLPDDLRDVFERLNMQAAVILRTVDSTIELRTADDATRAHRNRVLSRLHDAIGAARAAIECERQKTDTSQTCPARTKTQT